MKRIIGKAVYPEFIIQTDATRYVYGAIDDYIWNMLWRPFFRQIIQNAINT